MNVCTSCFNDEELINFIASNSSENGKCDYCSDGINSDLIEIGELLDFFAEFLSLFQEDENGIELLTLIEADWGLFSENIAGNDILCDIILALNISITNPSQTVSYVDEIRECVAFWDKLKEDLKWKRRFLTDIEEMKELGWDSLFNAQRQLPQDIELYRARVHKVERKTAYSALDMGCPDGKLVNGGRANPQGIPYLYLSKAIETTFYETRAIHLDELSIATFKIKTDQSIVLVDFTEETSTYYNIENLNNHAKSKLLKKLISSDLSKPIRRYDSDLEYIPTQFICEYIRYITGADGILFDSSLHEGGCNIVLFEQIKMECEKVELYTIKSIDMKGLLK